MIVNVGFDFVGEWWLDLGEVAIPPSDADWKRVAEVIETAARRLVALGMLIPTLLTVRSGQADPAIEVPYRVGQSLPDALAAVRAAVPSPVAITLQGATTLRVPPTELEGAVELELQMAGKLQLALRTHSDDWLPYSLHAIAQPEASAANGALLSESLHALEEALNAELRHEATSRFAEIERYGVRNLRNADDTIVDHSDELGA